MGKLEGIITRSQSGFYAVATQSGQLICELRGKLKKGRRTGDVAAVGDKVILSKLDDGSGMIEEIKPRHSLFTRLGTLNCSPGGPQFVNTPRNS